VSPAPKPHDVIFFETPAELRAWFDANHATADELWLGYRKKSTGLPSVTWDEVVVECLRVGWIDSVRYSIDEGNAAQRLTKRRKGSIWSARNVAIAERLIASGAMRPAGLAAFQARTPQRTGIYSFEQPEAAFTDGELAALQANEAAWAEWQRRPPSYRRTVTFWVTSAKRPETRARRLASLIEDSAAGLPVGPMRALGRRPNGDSST
jgi:uncharacterized protein YdeI (YjbR/CyaY-like superfamily)